MIRIAYFGYREWSFSLLDKLLEDNDLRQKIVLIGTVAYDKEKIDYSRYNDLYFLEPKDKKTLVSLVSNNHINIALFYGWSWIVPKEVTDSIDCVCLHPSLLPNYRGGSPIQHQIINNEQEGGLTLFRMNQEIDAGDILKQRRFSLTGRLEDIFGRIVLHGAKATKELINDYENGAMVYRPQENLDLHLPYVRRKPQQSQVFIEKLKEFSSVDFYNLVRALDDPYPNCYVELPNGKTLFIKEVSLVPIVPDGACIVNDSQGLLKRPIYIKLKDGFAEVIRYTIGDRKT